MPIEITNENYKTFIEQNILPKMRLNELNEDNIDDVYDYIVENFEITYVENNDERLKFIDGLLNYLEQLMSFVE